jgi:hypothetical protein
MLEAEVEENILYLAEVQELAAPVVVDLVEPMEVDLRVIVIQEVAEAEPVVEIQEAVAELVVLV